MHNLSQYLDDHLAPGWRKAYKWFSLQASAINVAFLVTWASMPDDIKTALPSWLVPAMAVFVLVVGMVGRMTKQAEAPSKNPGDIVIHTKV